MAPRHAGTTLVILQQVTNLLKFQINCFAGNVDRYVWYSNHQKMWAKDKPSYNATPQIQKLPVIII